MRELVILVVSVAAIDSLNPSTVLPALYLATEPRPSRSLLGFAVGIFTVNLAGGVLALILGDQVVTVVPGIGETTRYWGEIAVGVMALAAAGLLWDKRQRVNAQFGRADVDRHRLVPLIGAAIAIVELPTAIPYFAVIAAVAGSGAGMGTALASLVLFNVIFVAPVIVIALVRAATGISGITTARRAREIVVRQSGTLIAGLVLVLGIILISVGAIGLSTMT